MSFRASLIVAAAALGIVAACGGTGSGPSTITVPTTSTTIAAPGNGLLVILDGDGAVVTLRPDGSERNTRSDAGADVVNWQPTWSAGGDRLAWGEQTPSGAALVVSDGDAVTKFETPSLPFFAMWSPDGSRIGVLHDAAGGLAFRMVDVVSGRAPVVAAGAPFYFSWSPDGAALVDHVGGDSLSVLRPSGAAVLGSTSGDFQAPLWTEAGILSILDGELVVWSESGTSRPLAAVRGPTSIVGTSNGDRVALQVLLPSDPTVLAAWRAVPAIPVNAVVVLDVGTETIQVASSQAAFGFFWSPDGESLLMLVPAESEGEVEWRVWTAGEIVASVRSAPSAVFFGDLLPFFDQYAQAWSPWAPDSASFAFVGSIGGRSGVWIQDLADGAPRFLAEGTWVAWSPE